MKASLNIRWYYLVFVIFLVGCGINEGSQKLNHLKDQTSPYLIQHASNPIDWYPWGDEALNKAKEEDKLMVISIGYFSCHWCQVMEEETFTDTTVARLMNDSFVSIKVDREERPDIDAIYTAAAEAMIGTSGWPLNVVTTSEGEPLFIGTYFENEDWKAIIERAAYLYEVDPSTISNQAERLSAALKDNKNANNEASPQSLSLQEKIINSFDQEYAGLNSDEKFPNAPLLDALLEYTYYNNSNELDDQIRNNLDRIAYGGIRDHLNGGFFRYSTDKTWKVPHFEKMLYDNAQLVSVYAKASQKYQNKTYLKIAEETVEFLINYMKSDEGGYFTSLNAVSDGEEGKSYTWTYDELKQNSISETTIGLFSISQEGNWEDGKNVLSIDPDQNTAYNEWRDSEDFEILKRLSAMREKPETDSKILTGWNALLISGFLDLYSITNDSRYLSEAADLINFIIEERLQNFDLSRLGLKNRIYLLEDYAFLIDALINFYQVTFNEEYLSLAKDLTAHSLDLFYTNGQFRLSSEDQLSISVKQKSNDLALPSGNALMSKNLLRLGTYYYDDHADWADIAENMLVSTSSEIQGNPVFKGTWLQSLMFLEHEPFEVAILGKDASAKLKWFRSQEFRPDLFYLGGDSEGQIPLLKNKLVSNRTMIYVCQNKACKLPTEDLGIAYQLTLN